MSDFVALQQQWTAWLRRPESAPMPNAPSRRLEIYRELFFNNVSGFVENTFPIVKQQLPASQWMLLLKNFFALHYCQSPYFHDISYEFLQFLATQHELLASYPWLTELAHFEWIELAAEIADDLWPHFIVGDFWHNIPVANPFAWPLVYQWPVQRFAQSKQPFNREVSCLILHRNQDEQVQLIESNALTLHLLQKLQANHTQTGKELFIDLAQELNTEPASFCVAGQGMIDTFLNARILLGVR